MSASKASFAILVPNLGVFAAGLEARVILFLSAIHWSATFVNFSYSLLVLCTTVSISLPLAISSLAVAVNLLRRSRVSPRSNNSEAAFLPAKPIPLNGSLIAAAVPRSRSSTGFNAASPARKAPLAAVDAAGDIFEISLPVTVGTIPSLAK